MLQRQMTITPLLCAAAAAFITLAASAPVRADNAPAAKTLYQRLGGYDAIAAVTDDFIGRLVTDKQLGKFFSGVSLAHQHRIRQMVVDQLCAATGGPCYYVGEDMKSAHQGLGITDDDWNAMVKDFTATLDKFKVGQPERGELFAIFGKLKSDIVQQPAGM